MAASVWRREKRARAHNQAHQPENVEVEPEDKTIDKNEGVAYRDADAGTDDEVGGQPRCEGVGGESGWTSRRKLIAREKRSATERIRSMPAVEKPDQHTPTDDDTPDTPPAPPVPPHPPDVVAQRRTYLSQNGDNGSVYLCQGCHRTDKRPGKRVRSSVQTARMKGPRVPAWCREARVEQRNPDSETAAPGTYPSPKKRPTSCRNKRVVETNVPRRNSDLGEGKGKLVKLANRIELGCNEDVPEPSHSAPGRVQCVCDDAGKDPGSTSPGTGTGPEGELEGKSRVSQQRGCRIV